MRLHLSLALLLLEACPFKHVVAEDPECRRHTRNLASLPLEALDWRHVSLSKSLRHTGECKKRPHCKNH